MDINRKLLEYTPEEFLAMKGETLYVVESFYNTGGYVTVDKHFITYEQLPILNSVLGIELQIVDDTKFKEEAAKIYQDVYDSEFQQWVERKKTEDPTDPSYPDNGGYCDCEYQDVYKGMCDKCGRPRERIGG
jgi:hypothetical protein